MTFVILLLFGVLTFILVRNMIKPEDRFTGNKETSAFQKFGLLHPRSKLLGKDQHEWSGLWWRWAASFKENRNPVADTSGRLAYLGEQEEIFYLAGSFSKTPVKRTATVKAGKPIFFPIINELYEVPPHMPCQTALSNLAESFKPKNLFVEINGIALENVSGYKLATPTCFDLIPSEESPVVSIGHWIALTALPVGVHTLAFGAENGFFKQDITYRLHVIE